MKNIKKLRTKIENIDSRIISLLAMRSKVSKRIGKLKKIHNIAVKDIKREREIIKIHRKVSLKKSIDPVLVQKVFNLIIKYSKKIQKI